MYIEDNFTNNGEENEMNKWVKKSLPLAVAASMAFTVIPGAVDAKSDNGKGNNGKGNNKKVEQTTSQEEILS